MQFLKTPTLNRPSILNNASFRNPQRLTPVPMPMVGARGPLPVIPIGRGGPMRGKKY